MKISKFLFALIFAGIFASCSDDNQTNTNAPSSNFRMSNQDIERTFKDIISIDDTSEQLFIASALAPDDKLALWQYKFENFKSNNDLNAQQANFIEELQSVLSEQILTTGSPERNAFLRDKSEWYLNQAKHLFGENEGWYLLTKVENINNRIDRINGTTSGKPSSPSGIKKCECEKDSECKRLTGIGLWGLEWENGSCSNKTCVIQDWFFGFIESDNDARCVY